MNEFVIITDTACDIPAQQLEKWNVDEIDLTFHFENDGIERFGRQMPIKDFYDQMRNGGIAKTAAINPDTFTSAFEKHLEKGMDVLYLGFSSGLSTTFNSANIAISDLRGKYPERKIRAVDTLSASAGQGLCVYLASEKAKQGATFDEVADYIENIKLKICHWFTVDDLVYLKRGGRVSPTVALIGSILSIKPILHVDNEGHLINVSKVRGRKASISALADKYGELADTKLSETIFISHSDAIADAEYLKDLLVSRYGVSVNVITDIGPIIGAHSGPGTLAVFFVGKER